MVVIRLSRGGTKKRPFYHIVAADKRRARDCSIERLGYFNPIASGGEKDKTIELNMERTQYWISQGAKASDRVKQIIKMHSKVAKTEQTSPSA